MSTAVAYTEHEGTMNVLRAASDELIHAELVELDKRERMEQMIRDAVDANLSIDSISEATGLRPEQIREIVAKPQQQFAMLETLLGMR